MGNIRFEPQDDISMQTQSYLAARLDGARDLYLLALLLGSRSGGWRGFGRMIREARIHFAAVIEEARIAGFDTSEIAAILSQHQLEDAIRPEVWEHVEALVRDRRRD